MDGEEEVGFLLACFLACCDVGWYVIEPIVSLSSLSRLSSTLHFGHETTMNI